MTDERMPTGEGVDASVARLRWAASHFEPESLVSKDVAVVLDELERLVISRSELRTKAKEIADAAADQIRREVAEWFRERAKETEEPEARAMLSKLAAGIEAGSIA